MEMTDPVFAEEVGVESSLHKIGDTVIYAAAGAVFGSFSMLTHLGWRLGQLSSGNGTTVNEWLLFSYLSESSASHLFSYMMKNWLMVKRKIPFSQSSWHANRTALSQVPLLSDDDVQLVNFLERRWLRKATGFYPTFVNWIYPCFGVSLQINPETTSHYARNPSNKISRTYQKIVDAWKQILPHPDHYPLILTRPSNVLDYLPSYVVAETVEKTVEKLREKLEMSRTSVVLDVTPLFSHAFQDKKSWRSVWNAYHRDLFDQCKKRHLNFDKVVFIERVQHAGVGGIRLLSQGWGSSKKSEQDYQFLLDWVSTLGLSANLLELDRCPLLMKPRPLHAPAVSAPALSKEGIAASLSSFAEQWSCRDSQKKLMVEGTLKVLQALVARLNHEKWDAIAACPTRSSIVMTTFSRIKQQLQHIYKNNDLSFFETASHLEEIHAHLSTLLEIISPFTRADFAPIYREALTCVPAPLKHLISCAAHASGMTSMAGIVKAAEKMRGTPLRVLYGENSYFECIHLAEQIGIATPLQEATESDLEQVDLLIAQFNPALKRIDLKPTEYHVENIAESITKILNARSGKPLTVAIDCTFDYINSEKVARLLQEFEGAVTSGNLNVICYRSGLKFDLFGMDNYAGAPLYMIHNGDTVWQPFEALLHDPVLQTDSLSLNWFCLAYQNAIPELELYRKHIFDNTRKLLDQIPPRLFRADSKYRVIFVEQDADIAFLDIKISGAFHQIRGAALVGGCLYIKSMEEGQPIFYRPSVGFYHPNFTMLFSEENTTIRLTLGLDPKQVDVLKRCFTIIDALNGAPIETLRAALNSKPYYKKPTLGPENL